MPHYIPGVKASFFFYLTFIFLSYACYTLYDHNYQETKCKVEIGSNSVVASSGI